MRKNNKLRAVALFLISTLLISACGIDDNAQAGCYTYRDVFGGSLSNFSPTDFQGGIASTIFLLTTTNLYNRYINADKTAAEFVPELAAEFPVDVTEKYSGSEVFHISEEEKEHRAWQVKLREGFTWENGEEITAKDVLYSIRQYLDPELKSYRASLYTYGDTALANAMDFYAGELTDYDRVGVVMEDDYTVTFIFENPVSYNTFMYSFPLTLVYEPLYESLKEDANGLIKSSYGNSIEKYMSYGPYKIDSYQEDKSLSFSKNENWACYQDPFYADKYMTTNVDFQAVNSYTTMKSLFLQGKLDCLSLTSESAKDFGTSDYSYDTTGTKTTLYNLNCSLDSLKSREKEGENKSILSYVEFRKAFSLSLDRVSYVAKFTAVCEPAYGLFNDQYICNLDTMEKYRNLEVAKKLLVEVYDADNVDAISGYDIEGARENLVIAYEKCLGEGNIKPGDKVVIDIITSSSDNELQKQVDFLQDSLLETAVGTPLEGRIEIRIKVVSNLWETADNGEYDCLRMGWSGGVTDAYNIMQCYTDPDTMIGCGYDTEKIELTIDIEGENITKSMYDWYLALCSGEYAAADADIRNKILSSMEKSILLNYHVIPIFSSKYVELMSQRLNYCTENIIDPLIDRGDISQYYYTMDDKEWQEYCKSVGYHLTY